MSFFKPFLFYLQFLSQKILHIRFSFEETKRQRRRRRISWQALSWWPVSEVDINLRFPRGFVLLDTPIIYAHYMHALQLFLRLFRDAVRTTENEKKPHICINRRRVGHSFKWNSMVPTVRKNDEWWKRKNKLLSFFLNFIVQLFGSWWSKLIFHRKKTAI